MVSRINEQFWKEFFELYRSFPELWKIKSECYKNKNKKNAAYEVLLSKLKEIDSNANLDNLKYKINSFRSSYRRELKKKYRSEKSGAGVEDIHIPTLWYFDDLSFLADQEVQVSGHSSIEIEDEGDIVEENRPPSAKKYKKDYGRKERSELLAKAVEALDNSNQSKDDASTLSSTWELLFRKLSSTQQLFANKAIMEVLYQGALERLDESSYKLFEKKTTQHSFPPRSSSTPFFSSDTSSAASQYFVSTPLQSPNELISLQSHAHQLQPSREVITLHQSSHHSGPQQRQFLPGISINSHANGNNLDASTQYRNFNELFTDSDYS